MKRDNVATLAGSFQTELRVEESRVAAEIPKAANLSAGNTAFRNFTDMNAFLK